MTGPAMTDPQVAIVTGGASGIGLALVHQLRSQGTEVIAGDIDTEPLDRITSLDGVVGVHCDVRHRSSYERLRDIALEHHGRVDLVCLNAGVAPTGTIAETTESTWRWLFEVNVMGVAHGASVFAPLLTEQGSGHFLVTASLAGLVTSPGLGAYSASKHAVIGLTNTLREELEPEGVGVTVLCPGFVATNVFDSERNRPSELAGQSHPDPAVMEFVTAMVETAGLSPDEVAAAGLDGVRTGAAFVLPNADLDAAVLDRDLELHRAMRR